MATFPICLYSAEEEEEGGGAGFPVVESTSTDDFSTFNPYVITIPSGVVIGDLLLVVLSTDGSAIVSIDSGTNWTIEGNATQDTDVTGTVVWKIADGSDALTMDVTGDERGSAISFRISGAVDVDVSSADAVSPNADPPDHTPSGGVKNYLWIVYTAINDEVVVSAAPTDYTDLITEAPTTGGGNASAAVARRELNASSENPGTFTNVQREWVAFTIAVSPPGG